MLIFSTVMKKDGITMCLVLWNCIASKHSVYNIKHTPDLLYIKVQYN